MPNGALIALCLPSKASTEWGKFHFGKGHNKRKLKHIQKAISEMVDNEDNASAFSSRSQTFMSFIESDASNYSVHSPP